MSDNTPSSTADQTPAKGFTVWLPPSRPTTSQGRASNTVQATLTKVDLPALTAEAPATAASTTQAEREPVARVIKVPGLSIEENTPSTTKPEISEVKSQSETSVTPALQMVSLPVPPLMSKAGSATAARPTSENGPAPTTAKAQEETEMPAITIGSLPPAPLATETNETSAPAPVIFAEMTEEPAQPKTPKVADLAPATEADVATAATQPQSQAKLQAEPAPTPEISNTVSVTKSDTTAAAISEHSEPAALEPAAVVTNLVQAAPQEDRSLSKVASSLSSQETNATAVNEPQAGSSFLTRKVSGIWRWAALLALGGWWWSSREAKEHFQTSLRSDEAARVATAKATSLNSEMQKLTEAETAAMAKADKLSVDLAAAVKKSEQASRAELDQRGILLKSLEETTANQGAAIKAAQTSIQSNGAKVAALEEQKAKLQSELAEAKRNAAAAEARLKAVLAKQEADQAAETAQRARAAVPQ